MKPWLLYVLPYRFVVWYAARYLERFSSRDGYYFVVPSRQHNDLIAWTPNRLGKDGKVIPE